jgi:hypothetical protein
VICSPFCGSVGSCTATLWCGPLRTAVWRGTVEQADAPVAARSHHTRRPEQSSEPAALHLFEVVCAWVAQGEQDLELEATKQSRARVAHVVISWGCLRRLSPRSQQRTDLRPRARVGGTCVGTRATAGRGTAGVGVAHLGAHPDGGASLGGGGLVSGALDRGRLSSRPQNRLSHRAATGASLRGLAPLVGLVGPHRRAALATAGSCEASAPPSRPSRFCHLIWCRWWRSWPRCQLLS